MLAMSERATAQPWALWQPQRPPAVTRWATWLILAALSTFFAEVTCGNEPFALASWPGAPLMMLLYGSHLLVLAGVVFYRRRIRFATLYLAGVLFGLYEAYITKVVWGGGQDPGDLQVLGVDLFAALLLVLFWHGFMAFIVPLMVGEALLTRRREIAAALGRRWTARLRRPLLWIVAGAALGAFHGASVGDLGLSPLSSIGHGVIVALLVIFGRAMGATEWSLRQLLPRGIEWGVLLLLLLAQYAAYYNVTLWPAQTIPGPGPQAVVWAAYAMTAGLLLLSRRSAALPSRSGARAVAPEPLGRWVSLIAAFAVVSFGVSPLPASARQLVLVAFVLVGTAVGVLCFLGVAFRLLARSLSGR